MESKELRIGNLLNDRDGNLCKVFELGKNSILAPALNKPTTKLPNEPIPLTEEWLLKFGFEYTKLYYIKYDDDLIIYFDGIDFYFKRSSKSLTIKYVHQLQNLYFALTGEELNPL